MLQKRSKIIQTNTPTTSEFGTAIEDEYIEDIYLKI